MSTISCRPTGGQLLESRRASRVYISSYTSQKPTRSSAIPIPEESSKSLTFTTRLVENQPTRGPKRLTQPKNSAVNLNEFLSMISLKGMDPDEASLTDLHIPTEECINQVGYSAKVRNYRSWKYLTEFMLDVIRDP